MKKRSFFWRVNERITAPRLRVIDNTGKQIGVLPRLEALEAAHKKGLDLIEIAPNAQPPVAKIIDENKYRYSQEKKARLEKKKAKPAQQKEVRFSPFIALNDYNTRLEKLRGFLREGHKVKTTVKFLGRQMGRREFGYKLIDRIVADLESQAKLDGQPKFIGRHLIAIISPAKDSGAKKEKTNEQSKDKEANNKAA